MREGPPAHLSWWATEWAWLTAAPATVAAGRPIARLLTGAPGTGKTVLLDTLRRHHDHDVRLLHATGRQDPEPTPFGTVGHLLGPAARHADDVATVLDELGPTATPDELHRRLRALHRFTTSLVARGPLLLVVDDVHCCDAGSLAFLGFLLRRMHGLPIGLVLAARTDVDGVLPERLWPLRAPSTETLALRPAERAGTETPLPPPPVAEPPGSSRRRTDETVDWHLRSGGPCVGRLTAALAVAGPSTIGTLAAVAGVGPGPTAGAVRALARTGVLTPDGTDLGDDRLRTAVLDRIPDHELGRLRRRAARVLNDAGAPAERIAELLLQLPDPAEPWMLTVLQEAADRAADRSAFADLARYLAPVVDARPADVALRSRLASALAVSDPTGAVEHLRVAHASAVDPARRMQVAVQLAMASLPARGPGDAAAVLRSALEELDHRDAVDDEPQVLPRPADLRTSAEAVLLVVGLDRRRTVARTIERSYRTDVPEGDTEAGRHKLAMLATALLLAGRDPARTVELARRAAPREHTELAGWTALACARVLRLADRCEESVALLEGVLRRPGHEVSSWTRTLATSGLAEARLATGELAAAEAAACEAMETARRAGRDCGTGTPSIVLAGVHLRRGAVDRATEVLAARQHRWDEDLTWEHHDLLLARGDVAAARGRHTRALALYRRCGAALDEDGIANAVFAPWWARAALLLADLGRPDDAAPVVEHGAALAARWGTPRARGLALTARGATTPGPGGLDLLAEAVAVLDDSPARSELVEARLRWGTGLLASGHVIEARRQLREAATLAARCGATREASRARAALHRAGGRMRRPTGSPLDPLTSAERRVVRLAAGGARNREIARALFVTVRTVEVHLTSAFRKLDVTDRTGLAPLVAADRGGAA